MALKPNGALNVVVLPSGEKSVVTAFSEKHFAKYHKALVASRNTGPVVINASVKSDEMVSVMVVTLAKSSESYLAFKDIAYSIAKLDNRNIQLHMHELPDQDSKTVLCHLMLRQLYRFDKYSSDIKLRGTIAVCLNDKISQQNLAQLLTHAVMTADLENEPGNMMGPSDFVVKVKDLLLGASRAGRRTTVGAKLSAKVLSVRDMKRLGMNLVLGIGLSAIESRAPQFLVVELITDQSLPNVCLVGKGVVFDTGGLALKPVSHMQNMQADKSGASVVAMILHYFAKQRRRLPFNVIGLMPMVENAISNTALRPGDVVKSMSGLTVEIKNPDAEGRLIMADALTYSAKYRPDFVLDFATLTGAAKYIHCDATHVYFAKNDKVSDLVYKTAESCGERSWRLPPWSEYIRHTRTSVSADIDNINTTTCKRADTFMASMFLLNFVPRCAVEGWVHFDMAGNDRSDGLSIGAGTMLGIRFLENLAERYFKPADLG